MQYYRCKCGSRESWGSMPPSRCAHCNKCVSDLAQAPDLHQEPEPHRMHPTTVQTDDGSATLTRCRWCGETRTKLEKRGDKMELC